MLLFSASRVDVPSSQGGTTEELKLRMGSQTQTLGMQHFWSLLEFSNSGEGMSLNGFVIHLSDVHK